MKRKTLALAELALATKIRELQDLEKKIDVYPRLAVRRIPFVLAQIEELRKMVRQGQMEQTRSVAIKVVRAIKEQSANEEFLTCEACDWSHPMPEATKVMHVHHVVPISRGGDNEETNLILLCPNCHAVAHLLMDRGLSAATRDDLLPILQSDPLTD